LTGLPFGGEGRKKKFPGWEGEGEGKVTKIRSIRVSSIFASNRTMRPNGSTRQSERNFFILLRGGGRKLADRRELGVPCGRGSHGPPKRGSPGEGEKKGRLGVKKSKEKTRENSLEQGEPTTVKLRRRLTGGECK